MTLKEIRVWRGLTQQAVATKADMSQGQLSRTERGHDHQIKTIRRLVAAMGGEVQVWAEFGPVRMRLR